MAQQINDLRAKYNANGNAIIPNTFQHPNIFIDRLMYYLSPSENVVLTFAVRRILGFQSNIMSRKDNISLSQFTDGITAEDGRPLSMGTGLGTETVINALDGLEKYKILLATTKNPDPKKGQEYWLQENENAIDWEGLAQRDIEKRLKSAKRTQKARYSVGQNTSVGQNPRGLLDRDTKPTETHTDSTTTTPAPVFEIDTQSLNAQSLYTAITQQVTFPASWEEKYQRALSDVLTGYFGGEVLKAAKSGKPVFSRYCNTRGEGGAKYRPTGTGWLDWWQAELAPVPEGEGVEKKPKQARKVKTGQPQPPEEDDFMEQLAAKRAKLKAEKEAREHAYAD